MTGFRRMIGLALLPLGLAACGDSRTNPPTEPAEPVDLPEAAAPPAVRPPEAGEGLPGTGPASFVGRWAADAAWCANTTGAERPIEITTTRFEGYENSCSIDQIEERQADYNLVLTCQAEGATARERVNLAAEGDGLRMSWPDRNGAVVVLTRCPAAPTPS